jgi:hypothetical protein
VQRKTPREKERKNKNATEENKIKSIKKKGELQIACAKIKRGNEKTKNYYKCKPISKNIRVVSTIKK